MRNNKKIDVTYSILPMIGTTFCERFCEVLYLTVTMQLHKQKRPV